MMLDHILESLARATLVTDPYPCLIFDEFIDDESSRILTRSMPEHIPFYHAHKILKNENELWQEYISSVNNPIFQIRLMERLGSKIKPQLHEVGLRSENAKTKFVTESYMAIRDPDPKKRVEGFPSNGDWDDWLLYPHVDSHYAITSMVHFFRGDDDDDDSGSLRILRRNRDVPELISTPSIISYAKPEGFDVVHDFPYRRNFAAAMLCGPEQWHGIGPRHKNTRRSVNMSIEWQNEGFRQVHKINDPPPYLHKLQN